MIGEVIGQQYEVTALLGAGSMGEVYKGWDRALGRHVALKVLKPGVGAGSERFRAEAQILANLNHGNICQVYGFLQHGGRDVMVLQHLDGTSLDSVLEQQGRLPWAEVKAIAADVLAGLTEAHHAKVVHRDLKPANLMRVAAAAGYKTVIMDFGIARAQGHARATREGMVACTIEYASPEQIQGEDVGPGSDLYSLGMVLYELLTGGLAFGAKTDAAWAHAHVYETPDWDKVAALHGKHVAKFVRAAVEKKQDARYASAQAMLQALRQVPDTPEPKSAWLEGLMASLKGLIPTKRPSQALSDAPEPQSALIAQLKEHWAFVFLGLMLLLGGIFFLMSFAGRPSVPAKNQPDLPFANMAPALPAPAPLPSPSQLAAPPAAPPPGQIVLGTPSGQAAIDLGAPRAPVLAPAVNALPLPPTDQNPVVTPTPKESRRPAREKKPSNPFE